MSKTEPQTEPQSRCGSRENKDNFKGGKLPISEVTHVSAFSSASPAHGPPLFDDDVATKLEDASVVVPPRKASSGKVVPLAPDKNFCRSESASQNNNIGGRRPSRVSHDAGRRPSISCSGTPNNLPTTPHSAEERASLSRGKSFTQRRNSLTSLGFGYGQEKETEEPEHIHQSIHDLPDEHQKYLTIVVEEFQVQSYAFRDLCG